jgi:hypothetical protein
MTTRPNLDGPRAKIERAIEHKDALDAAIDEWVTSNPIGIRVDRDAEGWTNLIYIEQKSIPLRVGAIFADYANNLESALDLLVSQLVLSSNNKVSTGNYFPVVSDPARWDRARNDKLKGVRDDWAATIRDSQPLADEPTAYKHPLVVLHSANNTNKHTVLMPAVVADMQWEPTFQLNRDARSGEYAMSELDPFGTGPRLRNGDVLVRVRALSDAGDLEITGLVGGGMPGGVGIGWDDFPVDFKPGDDFPDLLGYVVGVVDKFE